MKPLILITSCSYRLDQNWQCRKTWLQSWGHLIDYRFVLGVGNTAQQGDELIVDTDDSYTGLPAKIQKSHEWAVKQGYDFILKTDSDVYMHVPRLLKSGFEKYDYSGNFYYPDFAMGSAYWLSRHASEILINSPLPYPGTAGGDDVWVGSIMKEHQVSVHHEPRYYVGANPDWKNFISVHTTDLDIPMSKIHESVK